MSADRYEISEGELDVLAITGPEGTRYIDGEEIEARVIRQLRSDLAAVTAERNEARTLYAKMADERDVAEKELAEWGRLFAAVIGQGLPGSPALWPFEGSQDPAMVAFAIHQLRAQLAEYVEAPVVAVVRADYNDTDAWNFIDCDNMPEAGTELIARPKVRK